MPAELRGSRGSLPAWQGEKINPVRSPSRPLSLRDISLFLPLAFQAHFSFPSPARSLSGLKLPVRGGVSSSSFEGEKDALPSAKTRPFPFLP